MKYTVSYQRFGDEMRYHLGEFDHKLADKMCVALASRTDVAHVWKNEVRYRQ